MTLLGQEVIIRHHHEKREFDEVGIFLSWSQETENSYAGVNWMNTDGAIKTARVASVRFSKPEDVKLIGRPQFIISGPKDGSEGL